MLVTHNPICSWQLRVRSFPKIREQWQALAAPRATIASTYPRKMHFRQCACPYPVQRCRHQIRAALRQPQVVLADAGIQSDDPHLDPVEVELRRFDEHMQQAKGLAENTRIRRLSVVRSMLNHTASALPAAGELRHFIAQELTRICLGSAGSRATALRSYLRFRAFEGDRVEHLLPLIASPAWWRLAPLPQTLSRNDIERLLGAFPSGLPSRLRSYAIVRCLVDLGLRTREVSSLTLEDIDRAAGTLGIVKCKSRCVDLAARRSRSTSRLSRFLRRWGSCCLGPDARCRGRRGRAVRRQPALHLHEQSKGLRTPRPHQRVQGAPAGPQRTRRSAARMLPAGKRPQARSTASRRDFQRRHLPTIQAPAHDGTGNSWILLSTKRSRLISTR
jgi:integrase